MRAYYALYLTVTLSLFVGCTREREPSAATEQGPWRVQPSQRRHQKQQGN